MRPEGSRRWLLLGQGLLPLVIVLAVTWLTPARVFEYKYFQPMVPWLFMALGVLLESTRRAVAAVGALVVAAVVAVNLWACASWHAAPVYWGPQPWRQVLESIGPQMVAGDHVVVHPSMMMTPVLAYGVFDPRLRSCVTEVTRPGEEPALRVTGVDADGDVQFREPERQAKRLWLLTTPYHPWVVRQRLVESLRSRWRIVAVSETDGFWPANRIRVYLMVPRRIVP